MELHQTNFNYKNIGVRSKEGQQLFFSLEVYNDTYLDNKTPVILEILTSDITTRTGLILGRVEPEQKYIQIYRGKYHINFIWQLIDRTISELEKVRSNGNLDLELRIPFIKVDEPSQVLQTQCLIDVPKSKWVEDILPRLGFDSTVLISLPILQNTKVYETLQKALKQFYIGDYPNVLVDCQKSLEEIKSICKTYALVDDGAINFGKLSDSKNIQDSLNEIMKKLFLFFQNGGRHSGRAINKEDAEMALLVTYGLVNWILVNLPTSEV
jgi:hypothetical protein